MKKGQITVMIIIVMILLFIIGMYSFLSRKTAERESETIIKQTFLEKERITPIEKYVTDCISLSLQEGLNITDSLGVESLRRKIHSRIREVEQLILDEDLIA